MMDAVRLAIIGGILLLSGVLAMVPGVLPIDEALAIGDRVWPILVFVVAVTVVAELAATAGVFDVASAFLARLSRGRTWLLWALTVTLAIVATAFLSLDTTAVLLTPVVIATARAHRLDPLPFALATVWLANTASLVLPVSNLTNLLALAPLGDPSPWSFVALMGIPALVAILVTVALLVVISRRSLTGRFRPAAAPVIADRLQLRVAGAVVIVLLPLLVSGLPPWIPATVAALILTAFFAWRSPGVLRLSLVPGSLVVFAAGLFLAVGALEAWGSASIVSAVAGSGDGLLELLRLAGTGALGANAINNLPAYLALETAASSSPERIAALLIGVNAGPLITPWASLATLLWHARLTAAGVTLRWSRFVVLGLLAAPSTVVLSVVALWLVRGA